MDSRERMIREIWSCHVGMVVVDIAEMVHPFAKTIANETRPNRVVVADLPFRSITHPM
jgi:protein-S-isoprenylcysteine O-methyltransferase Ste14